MSKLKSLYTKQILSVKETISSGELSTIDANDISKINTLLLEKVKNKIGNRCNENGYVNKDSINIVSRSIGSINSSHFNGDIIYNLDLEADVCIPTEGNRFKCKVVGKNKMGIMAVEHPVHVILASVHHNEPNVFSDIDTGDIIEVEVINFKYKLNADDIKIVGKLISKR